MTLVEGKAVPIKMTWLVSMHPNEQTKQNKPLTSRRSSPARSSSRRFGRPPLRSEAGPSSHSVRWLQTRPASGSPAGSDPPFPGSPSCLLRGLLYPSKWTKRILVEFDPNTNLLAVWFWYFCYDMLWYVMWCRLILSSLPLSSAICQATRSPL